MNKIRFAERTLEADASQNVKAIRFYDVLVDEKSLFDEFISAEDNMVCCFGFYNDKKLNGDCSDEFLTIKTSELNSLRTPLFVCRECGDIGCGAITLEIVKKENSYVWKKFAHENDSFELEESDFIDFPSVEFDKTEYEEAINSLKTKWL